MQEDPNYSVAAPGTVAALASKAAAPVMIGVSAGGNAYNEALANGYTPDKARGYGLLVGTAEAGLSYLLSGISAVGGKITGNVLQSRIDAIRQPLLRVRQPAQDRWRTVWTYTDKQAPDGACFF